MKSRGKKGMNGPCEARTHDLKSREKKKGMNGPCEARTHDLRVISTTLFRLSQWTSTQLSDSGLYLISIFLQVRHVTTSIIFLIESYSAFQIASCRLCW